MKRKENERKAQENEQKKFELIYRHIACGICAYSQSTVYPNRNLFHALRVFGMCGVWCVCALRFVSYSGHFMVRTIKVKSRTDGKKTEEKETRERT